MSHPGPLRTSVVIPTHARCARLPMLIAPLLVDRSTHEVVVIVDGGRDGSVELLNRLADNDHRVIPVYQDNQGASVARSAGVAMATGEVVLLLDDDVEPEPGLVSGHTARHTAGTGLVVVGYMPIPCSSNSHDLATYVYSTAYESACRRWDENPGQILETLWAGNLSMRREDAIRVGLAKSARFGYHADRELGIRCHAAGLEGVFDRSLRATHRYERSFAGLVQDARAQGRDFARLRMEYPDVLEPADRTRLMGLSGRPVLARLALIVLSVVVRIAAASRARTAHARTAQILLRIERERAEIEVRRGQLGAPVR